MKKNHKLFIAGTTTTLLLSGFSSGATFATGYTIGSGALGSTIVDGATHAGLGTFDIRANDTGNMAGAYVFVNVYDSLWTVGDQVSLTGIALPVRSPNTGTANNTSDGTFTFTFYELTGGASTSDWNGSNNGEVALGTVDVTFSSAGTGAAIIPYATFDTPLDFTATSPGIAIHVDSTGSIRTRADGNVDGVDGSAFNRLSGAQIGGADGAGHQWTLAGTVTPVPEPTSALLSSFGLLVLLRRRR